MIASLTVNCRLTQCQQWNERRSANDKFSDYIRGVDTVDDPYYGTSQHSYTEIFIGPMATAVTRNANDPTYNPNQSESATGN